MRKEELKKKLMEQEVVVPGNLYIEAEEALEPIKERAEKIKRL